MPQMNPDFMAPPLPHGKNCPMPTNHVLVDFENVCEIDTAILEHENVMLVLLVGAGRTKLDLDLVERLLIHAASVQLIRLSSRGKNALDFALAYYLGCAASADPTGVFHIISKDKGFDPLIEHLRSKHIRVRRHDDFATLTFSARTNLPTGVPPSTSPRPETSPTPKAGPATMEALGGQVLAHLRKAQNNRPRSRAKLVSYVITQLGNGMNPVEAESLVERLAGAGRIVIDSKGAVTYRLE